MGTLTVFRHSLLLISKTISKTANAQSTGRTPECPEYITDQLPQKARSIFYADPAFDKASSASESVGKTSKARSTFVISKTLRTRRLTPVRATRRPDFVNDVQALINEPRPEESR